MLGGYHNAAKWSKRGFQAGSLDSCCEMFAISRGQGQASVITSRGSVYLTQNDCINTLRAKEHQIQSNRQIQLGKKKNGGQGCWIHFKRAGWSQHLWSTQASTAALDKVAETGCMVA
ncbi:hypothetical protein XPA_008986 [Xanthoria parietina]